ncbi:response regulator transcription factor [bacterium]|nr:response regulator transcription factor [bacterium]
MSGLGNILIVDDNAKLLADALPMYGYEVRVAENGKDAIKTLAKSDIQFDIILLDVVMPIMDGWETLKLIRSQEKYNKIPIIMLTSVDEVQKQISGLKFGADDYIVKPFVLPNLLARIEACLRRTKWGKESAKEPKAPNKATLEMSNSLTNKETEILKLLVKGATNADISAKLFIKEVTVKSHLNNIYKKLNVENRVQAILLAQQIGIL